MKTRIYFNKQRCQWCAVYSKYDSVGLMFAWFYRHSWRDVVEELQHRGMLR